MRTRAFSFCLILICLCLPAIAGAAQMRVLVDVSGSMKRNDPDNLRTAAAGLVVELLPASANAGVWTFAESPQVLVAPGPASEDWKRQARGNLPRIHSRGQYTDIKAIVEAAVADWLERPAEDDRSVLLLTDGVVDVAGGDAASARSRDKLLGELAPALREAGIAVHTVALSEHADIALLETVADITDGRFEYAESAEQLNRVFLHMFEQSVERDAVPLVGNAFQIDASISEFTLLAFRPEDGSPVELETPDGTRLSATAPGEGVSWRRESGYDLVTVRTPPTGTWTLGGVEDPDNLVMIVTDLGLSTTELPRYLLSDEPLEVRFHLTEKGERIDRKDFLALVDASVALEPGAEPMPAALDERLEFRALLPARERAGEIEVELIAESGTFQRALRRRVTVVDNPLSIETDVSEGPDGSIHVSTRLVANEEVLAPDTVRMTLAVTGPDGSPRIEDVPAPLGEPVVETFQDPGAYRLAAMATARTVTGREVSARAETPAIEIPDPTALPPPESETPEVVEDEQGGVLDPLTLGLVLGPANLGLIGGIVYSRRRLGLTERPDAATPEKSKPKAKPKKTKKKGKK